MSEHDETGDEGRTEDHEGESLLDRMRHSGVGVEDPNIVGDPEPGIVEDQIGADEEPEV
jgi:molybdopterin-biosynthesis enzyme MoeA-like protein